ncbi:MAG TPA: NAD(P)/FAD-dependent oxidoreductase [Chthoniobacterales bacterium]|jgi:flavin-dependent dehydrogenase
MQTKDQTVRTVAVIGGGPSGATVAAFLARAGFSVVIFDQGSRPDLVVGESLVPQLVPIFRELGIEERVAGLGIKKPGVTVTFDANEEIKLSFTAVRGVLPTYAYNVPRDAFDQLLLDVARESGARLVPRAAALEINPTTKIARLKAESLGMIPEWKGRQPDLFIDATGRRRLFARLAGVEAIVGERKDVSHFAHYEDCPMPEPVGQVITMRLAYGWGWRIPLPGPKLSVGVVLNKEDAKRFGNTPEEQLEGIIDDDPRLGVELKDRRRVSPIATYANYQLISKCGSGPNWAMVGDAFGFVDPMLSPGVCMAMESAQELAKAVRANGASKSGLAPRLTDYWHWLAATLSAWQNLIDYFYDGRIFAMQKTGMDMGGRFPGKLNEIIQRHIEKNLSGMASGAYIARPYSRFLLRFLGRYGIRGWEPAQFAIR